VNGIPIAAYSIEHSLGPLRSIGATLRVGIKVRNVGVTCVSIED